MLQNFENFIYEESVNDEPFFAKLPMSVRNNFFFFLGSSPMKRTTR